jgi:outer membrane protein assembly factor BamB
LHKLYWGAAKDQRGDDAYSTCCGAAASPLVDGKQVLLPVGGKKAGALTAFDRGTGKVLWKSPLTDRSSYGSGLIVDLAGRKQIVGFTGLRLGGFSRDDGKLLWDLPFEAYYEQTIQTPVVWKGRIIIGGEARETLALEVSEKDGKFVTKTLWKNDRLKSYLTTPVAVKDHLYGLSKRGELVCVDLDNGKTAWAGGNFGTYGTITAAGDVLLVLTSRGELHVIEANPKKLVRKARWKVGGDPVWTYLAVVGSRLYVKDNTDVICYDLREK